MTADRTAATAEEFADRVAPFDAAPAAEESAVERVARAIAASDGVDFDHYLTSELSLSTDYRRNARAAIDAMRPAPDAPRAGGITPLPDHLQPAKLPEWINRDTLPGAAS
jgi:hypothetical protein